MTLLTHLLIVCTITLLNGCAPTIKTVDKIETSTESQTNLIKYDTKKKVAFKNPIAIKLYNGTDKPKKPYTIIGKETISKFNNAGTKRQEANLKDIMRKLASSLGGDAVIDIVSDNEKITGTVVLYYS